MSAAGFDLASPSPDPQKRLANVKARAALAGATVYHAENDRGADVFLVSKFNLCRELSSIEAVEQWLDRLAGNRATAR